MVPYPILTAVLQPAAFKPGYYQQGDCRRLYNPPQPLPPPPSSTVQYYYFIKTNFFILIQATWYFFLKSTQTLNKLTMTDVLQRSSASLCWTIISSEHFKSRQKDLTVQMIGYLPFCFDAKRSKKTKNLWNRSSFSFSLNNISRDFRFRFWNRDNCSENFLKNQP